MREVIVIRTQSAERSLARPQRQGIPSKTLFFLILALAVGLYFRFTHLDAQVYWHDEAYTSLRISGYSAAEVNRRLFTGEVTTPGDLLAYQRVVPGTSIVDTVQSLALEDSQHPPLYYGLARLWAERFGASVATVRSLSVWLSLLLFPGVYWLCQELFYVPHPEQRGRSFATLTATLAIALIAVSPFHLLYAQEAREYGLWSALITLSSAAWLRGLRCHTGWSWATFTLLLVLTLYTHPLTLFLVVVYGVHGLLLWQHCSRRTLAAGFGALAVSVLAYWPWLQIIVANWSKTGATWTSVPLPLPILLKTWGLHWARAFWMPEGDFGFDDWRVYLGLPLIVGLGCIAFYRLYRQTPLRTWALVLLLTGSTVVPLGLMDLVMGGQRSVSSRYVLPFYVGLPIAIAYFFATQFSVLHRDHRSRFSRQVGRGVAVVLLAFSVICCAANANADTAWPKGINYNLPTVARLINQAERPLLVSHSFGINFGTLLALSHRLEPDTQLQLVNGWAAPETIEAPTLPSHTQPIFLLNPNDLFRHQIEAQQHQKATLVFQDTHLFLWKLDNQSKK
ncbi:MAG TPA: hypothetical protein V6D19_07845 [Stenomitos sp.]